MLYSIKAKNLGAQIETWDGVVVQATPSMRWAIGMPLGKALAWLNEHNIQWENYSGKPSASLTHIPLKELPDAELLNRVSPETFRNRRIL